MAVNKMSKVSLGAGNRILFATKPTMSVGVVVSQALGESVGTQKIVRAGTPVKGDLTNRTTAFTAAGETDAVGVLLHDVDVTAGDNNATLLIHGFVDLNKVSSEVTAKYTEGVKTALKGNITFLK